MKQKFYSSGKECQAVAEFNIDLASIHQVSIVFPGTPLNTENSAINKADGYLWPHGIACNTNISLTQSTGGAGAPFHWEYNEDCQLHLGDQETLLQESIWLYIYDFLEPKGQCKKWKW